MISGLEQRATKLAYKSVAVHVLHGERRVGERAVRKPLRQPAQQRNVEHSAVQECLERLVLPSLAQGRRVGARRGRGASEPRKGRRRAEGAVLRTHLEQVLLGSRKLGERMLTFSHAFMGARRSARVEGDDRCVACFR